MKQLVSLVLAGGLCPVIALAQDAEPGGVFFTFDFGQSFEATSDSDLETPEEEDSVQGITDIRFGAVTETRSQRLSFDLGTGIRATEDELTNEDVSLRFAYSRNSADAVFDTSISALRSDISFLRDASDFINADGVLVLPDDFEDLTGSGIRIATTVAASLRWGETDPLGYRISASQQLLRYEDASAALAESDTNTVGAGVRLNINEVTTGNLDLSYSETDEVGAPSEDRLTLSTNLVFSRPLGDLTYQLSTSRNETDDVFWAGSISRSLALPRGSLAGSVGIVEADDGETRPTGSISFSYPRPTGQIDLSAARSLSPGGDRGTTTLRATFAQAVTPVSGMRFEITYAEASDPDRSDVLASGEVSGSYAVELNRLWEFNVGARINLRDDDGTRSRSNTVFAGLNRTISWRP